jgi:hypothetical protein
MHSSKELGFESAPNPFPNFIAAEIGPSRIPSSGSFRPQSYFKSSIAAEIGIRRIPGAYPAHTRRIPRLVLGPASTHLPAKRQLNAYSGLPKLRALDLTG